MSLRFICLRWLAKDMAHIGGIKADIESARVAVPARNQRRQHYGIYGQL